MTLVNMGSNSQVVTAIFQPREHLLYCRLITSEIVQVDRPSFFLIRQLLELVENKNVYTVRAPS